MMGKETQQIFKKHSLCCDNSEDILQGNVVKYQSR